MNKRYIILLITISLLTIGIIMFIFTPSEQERKVVFLQTYDSHCEEMVYGVGQVLSNAENVLLQSKLWDANEFNSNLYAHMVELRVYHNETLPKGYPVRNDSETDDAYEQRCKQFEIDRVKKILLQKGIYIIEDYSLTRRHCDFAIAGTMEDIWSVFVEEKYVGGWSCRVEPAPRQDIYDIAVSFGYTEDSATSMEDWEFDSSEFREWLNENGNTITLDVTVKTR